MMMKKCQTIVKCYKSIIQLQNFLAETES